MYQCNICNYNTTDRTAIYHHNKTKKHIKNKELYEDKIKNENVQLKDNEIEKLKQQLKKV